MSRRSLLVLAVAVVLIAFLVLYASPYASSSSKRDRELIRVCERGSAGQPEIECIYRVIERRLETGGLAAAMRLFKTAYETSVAFNESGCHQHAHRVGDMYYNETRTKGDPTFPVGGFPAGTTACGYGFFHGLFEHVTQDNPTSAAIEVTCGKFAHAMSSLRERRVKQICYHGSGHGLMLAESESVLRSGWGDASSFASRPLQKCFALAAEDEYKLQCAEGVFTMLVSWMDTRQFGFTFPGDPFQYCDAWQGLARDACYNEMAQKAGVMAPGGVAEYARVISRIGDEYLQSLAFETGIAGFVQGNISNGRYLKVFDACLRMRVPRQEECVRSLVRGLIEHGTPREEYRVALAFCADKVPDGDLRGTCYERVAFFLPHYHDRSEVAAICREFPDEMRRFCTTPKEDANE